MTSRRLFTIHAHGINQKPSASGPFTSSDVHTLFILLMVSLIDIVPLLAGPLYVSEPSPLTPYINLRNSSLMEIKLFGASSIYVVPCSALSPACTSRYWSVCICLHPPLRTCGQSWRSCLFEINIGFMTSYYRKRQQGILGRLSGRGIYTTTPCFGRIFFFQIV